MIAPITEVITEKNIVVLSPHYDDVVLTFGGYLDALVAGGLIHTKNIRIIHVFSRSNYQARDHEGNRDSSVKRIQFATGIRLLEDLNCLDDLIGHGNYIYELMAEVECMMRQKSWKEGEAFEFPQGSKADFTAADWEIYEGIKKYAPRLLSLDDTAILLPLGIKEHIDHILVREALMDAWQNIDPTARASICFGEDQPYAGHASENDWDKAKTFLDRLPVAPVNYTINAIRKSDLLMKHYPSQVEESYREGILNRADQLRRESGTGMGVERIYRVNP